MKNFKKILSLLMAFAMVLTMMPTSALAVVNTYNGTKTESNTESKTDNKYIEGIPANNRELLESLRENYPEQAVENGITSGTGNGQFSPNAKITRQEMCVMIVKFANANGITLEPTKAKVNFADESKIASWAKSAVETCQMADIISGDGTNFKPLDSAKRCEVAVIVTKYHSLYLA